MKLQKITEKFKNEANQDKVSASYLFYGDKRVDLLSYALMFSKMIMTKNIQNDAEKGKIERLIDISQHPDIEIINKNNENIKIDEVREIIYSSIESSFNSPKKIFILCGIENLRKGNFQIYLPLNEKMPLKNYDMINETKEAKSNLIKIAEGLRFIWENSDMPDNYNDDLGELSINLLDKFSNQTTVNLIVDIDRLKNRIREMIKNGVDVFFANLSSAIKNKMVNEINIFLAGNSSKSEYVKEIFEAKKIEMLDGNEKFNEKVKIFPPLGTEEAEEKQKEMGYVIDRNKFIPNGKTGVAYGSILLRKNGEIKTDISAEEVPFNYIVGRKRKGEFKDILNKEVGYDEWKKYIVANEIENEIYFTDDYSNLLKDSELKNIKTIMIDLDDEYDDDEYIYIRSISPNKIEYCVSNSEKIKKDEYIEEPKEIDLSNE